MDAGLLDSPATPVRARSAAALRDNSAFRIDKIDPGIGGSAVDDCPHAGLPSSQNDGLVDQVEWLLASKYAHGFFGHPCFKRLD